MNHQRLKRKLYFLTYDKPGVHRKIIQIKKNLDEVKRILECKKV